MFFSFTNGILFRKLVHGLILSRNSTGLELQVRGAIHMRYILAVFNHDMGLFRMYWNTFVWEIATKTCMNFAYINYTRNNGCIEPTKFFSVHHCL